MDLLDIVQRAASPAPWQEGEKIPWHEPAFSARMLHEHLSQTHDGASRRTERIDAHVRWIHEHLLQSRPTRVLDLGCGPGLYTARLAALGHECTGIDFSPASIAYAQEAAEEGDLNCTYRLADLRTVDFGSGFGLVMLIFGELNVFGRGEARALVSKARRALTDDGLLLLEAHTEASVQRLGEAAPTWRAIESGLFSERPHLRLDESFWDAERRVATHHYFIVHATSGEVTRHVESLQAYSVQEYQTLLADAGLMLAGIYPSLDGSNDTGDFVVLAGSAGS